MDAKRKLMIIGDLAVLLVAFIWGATNVVIRDALDGITPFWFCFLRFVVASAALMLLFGRRAFAMTRRAKVRGMLTGVVFSLAYLSGAVGLLYTTAGNQSFIVSMSVVFVPLCVWFLTKKFPGRHVMVSVALCLAGLCGLMLDGNFRVNPGDALSAFAMLCITGYSGRGRLRPSVLAGRGHDDMFGPLRARLRARARGNRTRGVARRDLRGHDRLRADARPPDRGAEIHKPDARRDTALHLRHLRQPARRRLHRRADDLAHLHSLRAHLRGRNNSRSRPRAEKEKITRSVAGFRASIEL